MTETLLRTKLLFPILRSPNLVPRPHLIERLDQGLQGGGKLTLISAPAGFGKTTVAGEWLHHLRSDAANHVAWLSLDEGDNDPGRFLAYLVAALKQGAGAESSLGDEALGILQSSQPPATAVITSLINDLTALPGRIVLALDDYHVIESVPVNSSTPPDVGGALTYLLEHLPQQLHLVIATREDPLLPLARLRARGQLSELRALDLRFSNAEAAEFLNQTMGLDLSPQDIAALEARTEGWIAGLQLAALSMQGREDKADLVKSFTGSHRYVLDYLIEEVLEQQPAEIQDFLLRTAVLERLTGSLCDAVRSAGTNAVRLSESPGSSDGTGGTGQATLEKLERDNLFVVPLDEERRWYRYHHLFGDLLRQRLRHTYPGEEGELHRRASLWYERSGFVEEAIEHALLAADFERAAELIARTADALWNQGDNEKLRRWLDRLPAGLVFSSPRFCVFLAWNYLANGEQEQAERVLQTAAGALDGADGLDEGVIEGRIAATRAFAAFYRGDIAAISHLASRALAKLPIEEVSWRSTAAHLLGDAYDLQGETADAHSARLAAVEASKATGNSYVSLIANLKLAIILRRMGLLQQTIEICEQQMQLAEGSWLALTDVAGWLLAIWAEALAELNDLDRAVQKGKSGVERLERGGDLAMLGSSYMALIRILFSSGDLAGAAAIAQKAERAAASSSLPRWMFDQTAAWQARIWLVEGDRTAVSSWAKERGLDAGDELWYLCELEHIVFARFLIAGGELDKAQALLLRLLEAAETAGRTARVIEIQIVRALAHQAAEETDRALAALEQALTLAEPGGFISTFVDEGPPMADLLRKALSRGITPDYTKKLLSHFLTSLPRQRGPSYVQHPTSGIVEPLSERELEVLGLIAQGFSNPEIAGRLYLSLNTVKAHTRNIYGKLDVHNRTQAVARARESGLLPLA